MAKETKTQAPLLQVQELKMYFTSRGFFGGEKSCVKAVDGVTFSIQEGQTFGLVGESGCGKTTTGKCVLRINEPTEGKIWFGGADITHFSKAELKKIRRQIQMIFQDPYGSLDPRQSAASIVQEALTAGGEKFRTKNELEDQVNALLETVGLSKELGGRYPHEMSGGQRQRLGIARALACDPKLIVCDEPVSALDVSIQAQIINLFKKLQRDFNLTYLFIAHDLGVVQHIADIIGVMYLGELVEVMDSEQLYREASHPYSNALLAAVPTTNYAEEHSRERVILAGETPSPLHKPSGCAFHPRCPYATAECSQKKPALREIAPGHMVACLHPRGAIPDEKGEAGNGKI